MKPTTRQGQIDHILSQLSCTQLQEFVRTKALHDADFRDILLISFADLLSGDEPAEPRYRQMLHDMAQRYADSNGLIHAQSTASLAHVIQQLLETARKATTPTRESSDLCLAVIHELPTIAARMEDPEDYVQGLMQTACNILWECYAVLPTACQQELFGRILDAYGDPLYIDLDLDSHLQVLLKDWAKTDKTRQAACLHQLEALLKLPSNDPWRKNYLLEQIQRLIREWQR